MDGFDRAVVVFLNDFTQQSWTLDSFVDLLSRDAFLKGGVLVSLLWWAWFRKADQQAAQRARTTVVATLAGAFVALAVASVLEAVLPFRARPIHEPTLELRLPFGAPPERLSNWSAFPSDNAVLCFALAAGLFRMAPRVGLLAVVFVTVLVVLPRLYLGLHYPSDMLGGALLGIAFVQLANLPAFRAVLAKHLLVWSVRRPGLLYAGLFVVSFQIATFFANVRIMGRFVNGVLWGAIEPAG